MATRTFVSLAAVDLLGALGSAPAGAKPAPAYTLTDVGTLGGTLGGGDGAANHVDAAGRVVGWASVAGDATAHAFLWGKGEMTDLSGADRPDCTVAETLNDHGHVVGETCDESAALLWTGGRQYDLASLVGPTDAQLTEAVAIDDRSRIVALRLLPDGNQRLLLLTPDR